MRHDLDPRPDPTEGSSLSTHLQMVGAGLGVTLIAEMAVPIETRSAAVARLGQPRPTWTIDMVWRQTNPLSAQLAHIAGLVRQNGLDAAQT